MDALKEFKALLDVCNTATQDDDKSAPQPKRPRVLTNLNYVGSEQSSSESHSVRAKPLNGELRKE